MTENTGAVFTNNLMQIFKEFCIFHTLISSFLIDNTIMKKLIMHLNTNWVILNLNLIVYFIYSLSYEGLKVTKIFENLSKNVCEYGLWR